MPYKARFSRIFLKKEKRLPRDIRSRVVEALREILMNPHVGVPLVGPFKGLWRVRIGRYRVIYEIDEKEKIVVFHDVDLRKRVYWKRTLC
jgi:mRNA interferase RelE/StbE